MSSAESFYRRGFDRSFASGAARQNEEMVHAPGSSSFADRVRRKLAGNRSYDKKYETKFDKNGSESSAIGKFIQIDFILF